MCLGVKAPLRNVECVKFSINTNHPGDVGETLWNVRERFHVDNVPMQSVHLVLSQQVNLTQNQVFMQIMPRSVQKNAAHWVLGPIMNGCRPKEILYFIMKIKSLKKLPGYFAWKTTDWMSQDHGEFPKFHPPRGLLRQPGALSIGLNRGIRHKISQKKTTFFIHLGRRKLSCARTSLPKLDDQRHCAKTTWHVFLWREQPFADWTK